MSSARWRAVLLIVAVAASAAVTAVAAASGSDEELNQALVLVEILKSGINRRTPFPVTKMADVLPLNYAVLGRAWPSPYDVPYYEYGGSGKMAPLFTPKPYYGPPPQRRFENDFVEGVSLRQHFANASRQLDYEDAFGAQPGVYGQENETELVEKNQGSKIPLMYKSTEKPMVNSSNMEVTDTTIKSETTEKENTDPEKETTKSVVQGSETTVKEIMKNTVKDAIEKTTATNPSSPATDRILKRITGKAKDQSVNDGNELEVAQAARELEREATDLRETSQRPKYLCRTTKPDHSKTTPCLGGGRVCKQDMTQLSRTVRSRGTTRVYLSRSSRPAIPLPENNAYCFTNPESPLCRTFI